MGFGGSWVFLYPLPFHGAGEWGDWATALFAGSVLLVGALDRGLVRRRSCDIVSARAARRRRRASANRIGLALGFGYLWPRRFATNPRPSRTR